MIKLDSIEEIMEFLADPPEPPSTDQMVRAVKDVTAFINEQTSNAILLRGLRILPEDQFELLKSFICDLVDVILQAFGVDASKALDKIAGNEGATMTEVIFGDLFEGAEA